MLVWKSVIHMYCTFFFPFQKLRVTSHFVSTWIREPMTRVEAKRTDFIFLLNFCYSERALNAMWDLIFSFNRTHFINTAFWNRACLQLCMISCCFTPCIRVRVHLYARAQVCQCWILLLLQSNRELAMESPTYVLTSSNLCFYIFGALYLQRLVVFRSSCWVLYLVSTMSESITYMCQVLHCFRS